MSHDRNAIIEQQVRKYWGCGVHKLDDETRRIAAEAKLPANNAGRVHFARIVAERVGIPKAHVSAVSCRSTK